MISECRDTIISNWKLRADTKIYRFVPWKHVDSLFKDKELVLVCPSKWEDPDELVGRPVQVQVKDKYGRRSRKIFQNYPYAAFSQSWTTEKMMDTMLRAYSALNPLNEDDEAFDPKTSPFESVLIGTTIGKLCRSLLFGLRELEGFHRLYMHKVEYLEREQMVSRFAAAAAQGEEHFFSSDNIARLLSLKKREFSLESEVRPIAIFQHGEGRGKVLKLSIDPNKLIESIELDPRILFDGGKRGFKLNSHYNREDYLVNNGFTGKIVESEIYRGALALDLHLDLDNPENGLSFDDRQYWQDFMVKNPSL